MVTKENIITLYDVYEKMKERRNFTDKAYDEEFEIPLIIKKLQGKQAVFFKGKRSSIPIVSNLIETRQKMLEVFGFDNLEQLYDSVTSPHKIESEKLFVYEKLEDYYIRFNGSVAQLGALKYYEKDAGFYFTSSIYVVKTEHSHNASIHRTLVLNDKELVARIVPRHLYRVYTNHLSKGEDTPVTILLGAHPAVELVSSMSPPYEQFEFEFLPTFLKKSKLPFVKSPVWGNPVPLGTGAIVEARITTEMVDEGPFVDIMGTYDRVRKQPLIRIEDIWVLGNDKVASHAILPGGGEHQLLMGITKEAQIWKAVSIVVPKVHKVRLTPASGGWLHAIVSIDKNHDEDGKNAIMAAFGAHPSLKHVVVVDGDIDVDDLNMVEWAIATRFQAHKGLIVINRARGSTLDPSSDDGTTSKVGIDATKPVNSSIIFERARIPGE